MQLLFIFDIVFIIHHIAFNILYLIIIINIHHHYSWDLSLYFIFNCYHLIFSIIFILIYTWNFLYINIWLSFSWSAHFDRAYIKVLNNKRILLKRQFFKWKRQIQSFQCFSIRVNFLFSFSFSQFETSWFQQQDLYLLLESSSSSFWSLILLFKLQR